MTILDYLNLLPDPYREEAIYNFHNCPFASSRTIVEVPTVAAAVKNGFTWSLTRQEDKYWRDLHRKLSTGEITLIPFYQKYLK